ALPISCSGGRNTAAELSQADVLAPIPTDRRRPRKDRLDLRSFESRIMKAMPRERAERRFRAHRTTRRERAVRSHGRGRVDAAVTSANSARKRRGATQNWYDPESPM